MVVADIDGDGQDELIISFDGYGLYVYDPDNAPANRWTQHKYPRFVEYGCLELDDEIALLTLKE